MMNNRSMSGSRNARHLLLALVAVLLLVATACGGADDTDAAGDDSQTETETPEETEAPDDDAASPTEEQTAGGGEPIRMGLVTGLTGDHATLGEPYVQGAEMAVDELNADGGVDGRTVELIVEDSESRPEGGVEATTKLVSTDEVPAVMHASFSGIFFPSAEYAADQDVLVVNAGSSSPDIREVPGTVVSTLSLDDTVARGLAEWAYEEGFRSAAVLVGNDPFGAGVNQFVTEAFEDLGGEIVAEAVVEAGQPDYRPDLQSIADSEAEVIFSATFADDAKLQFRQLTDLGVEAPWYVLYPTVTGLQGFEEANGRLFGVEIGQLGDEAAEWRARYADRYGEEPAVPWPALAYDTVTLTAMAIASGAQSPEELAAAFDEATADYSGPSGNIEFDDSYTRVTTPFSRLALEEGEFVPVE